mgnify:CR=1 FL=1
MIYAQTISLIIRRIYVAILVSVENTSHAPMIDGALALGNMLLAAESLGLGSCWIQAPSLLYTSTAGEKVLIKESFIPENHILIGTGLFGHKASESISPTPRRKDIVSTLE